MKDKILRAIPNSAKKTDVSLAVTDLDLSLDRWHMLKTFLSPTNKEVEM